MCFYICVTIYTYHTSFFTFEKLFQNIREIYITDKGGNYIEDIDEATNYSLEEIENCDQSAKPFHGFRKVEGFKYKVTAECEYKKRTKEEVKLQKFSSIPTILLIRLYMITVTLNNGLISRRKYMKVMATTLIFLDREAFR